MQTQNAQIAFSAKERVGIRVIEPSGELLGSLALARVAAVRGADGALEERQLAEESQQSAGRITGIVEEIRRATVHAAELVAAGSQRSVESDATVQRAQESFQLIGEAVAPERVGHIADVVARIATDTERIGSDMSAIGAVAEESSSSAEQVSASTEQTSASAQDIVASARELSATAAGLEQLAARFEL